MAEIKLNQIIQGDALAVLKTFPSDFVDTIITSPPYFGLRDYQVAGQYGLEKTLDEYIEKHLKVTQELKRVLKPTGVMFWNHGDCYGGSPAGNKQLTEAQTKWNPAWAGGGFSASQVKQGFAKCLMLQNYRLILKMIDEQGWILRNIVVWHKPNAMPSSVKDRFSNSYEPVFMLVKSQKYWFDLDAVRKPHQTSKELLDKRIARDKKESKKFERDRKYGISSRWGPTNRDRKTPVGGKNPGDVWEISTYPFPFDWCPVCNCEVKADQRGEGFIHKKCGNEVVGHFATFPEKLIEPIILSSTPQWICKKCGKARERILKIEWGKGKGRPYKPNRPDGMIFEGRDRKSKRKTLGWTDCGCGGDWIGGVVLDPFLGSGTVAVVAKKLGRNYIGIELKEDYIRMAERRLAKVSEPMKL